MTDIEGFNERDLRPAVRRRYTAGAQAREEGLCCPTTHSAKLTQVIPAEILERDYGCGDPSEYLIEGDVVLDLGSGAGKICYMAAQLVGSAGKVIGIDENPEMLALARKHRGSVSAALGYENVEFRRGRIEDLRLDLEQVDKLLSASPVGSIEHWNELECKLDQMRREQPLIPDNSIDVVISSCVLNLVPDKRKPNLMHEIYRVLRREGRAVISDIVSDEDVPPHLKSDPTLWSGCVSGAMREDRFLAAFEDAGFYGITIRRRDERPWVTVEGIEFRSVTIEAYKGKDGPCFEHNEAVIYRGPFRSVTDDDGHVLRRGRRSAVCHKTYELFRRPPYWDHFEFVEPLTAVVSVEAKPFDCSRSRERSVRETKGDSYTETSNKKDSCSSDGCC